MYKLLSGTSLMHLQVWDQHAEVAAL